MKKPVRSVTLSRLEVARPGKGGHHALWAFGYKTLAHLLGRSVSSVQRMVRAGKLDPADLEAVCKMWQAKRDEEAYESEIDELAIRMARAVAETKRD